MLPGARAFVQLATLSLVVLLTALADDTISVPPRVAAAVMMPAALATPPTSLVAFADSVGAEPDLLDSRRAAAPTPADVAAPLPVAAVAPTLRSPAPTPPPVDVASTGVPAPSATPPATCPSGWFCYPRLGIRGPIVPYTDCLGGSDLGTSIRSFTCLSPNYLMGHAYTSFGAITAWRSGDLVIASGRTFTITGAVTARSCDPPPLPLAPLSLQTSLSPSGCGAVLVVQAR